MNLGSTTALNYVFVALGTATGIISFFYKKKMPVGPDLSFDNRIFFYNFLLKVTWKRKHPFVVREASTSAVECQHRSVLLSGSYFCTKKWLFRLSSVPVALPRVTKTELSAVLVLWNPPGNPSNHKRNFYAMLPILAGCFSK